MCLPMPMRSQPGHDCRRRIVKMFSGSSTWRTDATSFGTTLRLGKRKTRRLKPRRLVKLSPLTVTHDFKVIEDAVLDLVEFEENAILNLSYEARCTVVEYKN